MQKSPSIETGDSNAVGIVVIGRNEGARLIACLDSLMQTGAPIVYVDSGSTDNSIAEARARGAQIVALDMNQPFTAARARNAGAQELLKNSKPEFIQFIDGDCTLHHEWISRSIEFLNDMPKVAVVSGEVEELFPERSLYNRMINHEWRGRAGPTEWCGGIALMRSAAFEEAGGFREGLIAGEEPELCVRLRENEWTIHRLNFPMAYHDADMHTLRQWLKRARRAGHAFAEVSMLHHRSQKSIWIRETIRPLFWTGAMLAVLLSGAIFDPAWWFCFLCFPIYAASGPVRENSRVSGTGRPISRDDVYHALLLMLQKPWEAAGVLQFWLNQLTGRKTRIIEYRAGKDSPS